MNATVETFTAENNGGGGVTHEFARVTSVGGCPRYLAACGAGAYFLRHKGPGVVDCKRCIAKAATR